ALATPGDNGLTVHAKSQILRERAWTVPTLSGTTLYVRDRHQITALDLGRKQAPPLPERQPPVFEQEDKRQGGLSVLFSERIPDLLSVQRARPSIFFGFQKS